MARTRSSLLSPAVGRPGLSVHQRLQRSRSIRLKIGLATLMALATLLNHQAVSVQAGTGRAGMGGSPMSEAHSGSLLVEYFKEWVGSSDLDLFRNRVEARYNEGTLGRILEGSPDVLARRAAVLALGIVGTFEHSNAVLAKALRDDDPTVRNMAEDALWAVWSRADTAEHNQTLERVRRAIGREQLDEAEKLATSLIGDAPHFAEAYNQRAFVYYLQERFAESAEECQQVLARNPFHIGAIEGLAKCQIRLNRPRDALKSLRRALKLRPHNSALRESIHELETQIESEGTR